MFYKISKSKSSQDLFKLIPEKTSSYVTRNADNIPFFNIRYNFYVNSLIPSTITEQNNLDRNLQNAENFGIFKNNIDKLIRPKTNSIFNCCNLGGIRLIKRLHQKLIHFRQHKFKYNFQNFVHPICSYLRPTLSYI